MDGLWALAVSALIAAGAWLYQRAWERHERRLNQYGKIVDLLPAFGEGAVDAAKLDVVFSELRRLWLVGPDEVIKAANVFFGTTRGTNSTPVERDRALAMFILAMRKDASFMSAVIPRFFRSRLSHEEIKLWRARPQSTKS